MCVTLLVLFLLIRVGFFLELFRRNWCNKDLVCSWCSDLTVPGLTLLFPPHRRTPGHPAPWGHWPGTSTAHTGPGLSLSGALLTPVLYHSLAPCRAARVPVCPGR